MFRSVPIAVHAFAGVLMFVAMGCASGPELDRYSRREIERPYTLPQGVASWHIPTVFGHIRDNNSSNTIPPIPFPLLWEQSLSDDWNLIWAPLPLGVSHQFSNTVESRVGFSAFAGFSYSTVQGFRFSPTLSFDYRHRFSNELALDLTPSFTPDIPFAKGREFRWSAGLTTGPLFQLTDTFALKPNVSLGLTQGRAAVNNPTFENINLRNETTFSMGLGLSSVWSIGRQWDLRSSYVYSGIGAKNGYQAHLGVLDFVHFW